MLIAFTGCWHSTKDAAFRAIDMCVDVGVKTLVQTGDFLYDFKEAHKLVKEIELYIEKNDIDIHIIGIRGNHDNPAYYASLPVNPDTGYGRISEHISFAPDGLIKEFGGKKIAFLGGAWSVDKVWRTPNIDWWAGEVTPPEAFEKLEKETFDVLVTHEPPAGIEYVNHGPVPQEWDIAGAEAHRVPFGKLIQKVKPSVVITGHMHRYQARRFPYDTGGEFLSVTLDHGHYKSWDKTLDQNNADFIYILDTDRV